MNSIDHLKVTAINLQHFHPLLSQGIPTYATAITEQPLKDTSAPNTSQHLGHQPIGDTSAPYTSQHLGDQPIGDTGVGEYNDVVWEVEQLVEQRRKCNNSRL